ncbi:MAG TPA: peptidoglycan bridge formation glycyltransferase FemA/FemB family protein [Candidatus Saccharimonadales bacterium]|nr:peptidoglycan bridge formation glycyltransferase FemA/FemB family protein [Candidatus Saccharimonadales bacterium]
MTVRYATQQEITDWNSLILANPDGGNIFQSLQMATVKSKAGWKTRFIVSDQCAMTVHERFIPGLGRLWYLPKGPGVKQADDITQLQPELRRFARAQGVFLIKIESEVANTTSNVQVLKKANLIHSHPIQPNSSTVILDIAGSSDAVMSALPQKSRHAIKRAFRDGIEIKQAKPTQANFTTMLKLMHETMAGKSTLLREEEYYRTFWNEYAAHNMGALFFAYDKDKPVAGAFVLFFGNKATYKDGGSTRQKTIYGASHALQWHIIEWLKEKGITTYDLCGTPPAKDIGNTSHPHYGIGRFKTGFNKQVTEFVGVYDSVVRPSAYHLWVTFVERIITRLYVRVLKKYFY